MREIHENDFFVFPSAFNGFTFMALRIWFENIMLANGTYLHFIHILANRTHIVSFQDLNAIVFTHWHYAKCDRRSWQGGAKW